MTKEKRLLIIGLAIVGFVVFAFNLNGPLFWDDNDWIVNNPVVHDPLDRAGDLLTRDVLAGIGQHSNYYRPVLMLSFAFNWALGGAHAWGYHLVSNLLHIASAILIFLLLSVLLKKSAMAGAGARFSNYHLAFSSLVAALAALFWLIHPIQPESVAYVSGRGDPLSVFLMLASILLFLKSKAYWSTKRQLPVTGYQLLGGSLLLAALALLSRETAVLLPVYLVIILMTFVHRLSFWRALGRSLKDTWPFIALSGVYVVARLTFLNFANTLNWHQFENVYSENVLVRIWTFFSALVQYLRLSIFPTGLHMEHSIPVQVSPGHWSVLLGGVFLIGALTWVVIAWRRGSRIPFFGVLLFLVPLAPASGILAPINSIFYEHWLYVSLLGAGVLLAYYGVWLYPELASKRRELGIAFLSVSVIYGMWFAAQSVQRNRIWTAPERLYNEILEYEPKNVRVLNNLANIYAEQGDNRAAQTYWERASQADPTQPAPYHNLANLARSRGELETAQMLYLKAIEVQPSFQYAYRSLTGLLLEQERYADAVQVLAKLRDVVPSDPAVHYTLAQTLHLAGRDDLALQALADGRRYANSPEALEAYDRLESELSP